LGGKGRGLNFETPQKTGMQHQYIPMRVVVCNEKKQSKGGKNRKKKRGKYHKKVKSLGSRNRGERKRRVPWITGNEEKIPKSEKTKKKGKNESSLPHGCQKKFFKKLCEHRRKNSHRGKRRGLPRRWQKGKRFLRNSGGEKRKRVKEKGKNLNPFKKQISKKCLGRKRKK